MTESQERPELVVFYSGRGTRVRVIREMKRNTSILRVEWYTHSLRHVKDYPDTKRGFDDAKSYAQSMYNAKMAGSTPTRRTVSDIWQRYQKAEFPGLANPTRQNYTHAWEFFQRFVGPRYDAESVTHDKLDELRDALRRSRTPPLSVRMVQNIFAIIRRVYRWAEGRELITRNRPVSYRFKVAKAERSQTPDEYTPDERDQIIAHLDPTRPGDWRAYGVLVTCGMQGARQHSVLHLQWSDFSDDDRLVTWQGQWDKNGRTWQQPVRESTRAALAMMREWRQRIGYTGPLCVSARA